jgi:hypothetical protein
MSRFRRNLLASGLGGLVASGLLTAAAIWLVVRGAVHPLLPYRALALLFALVLGAFSVAEIPMMVFAMRRLLVERRANQRFVLGLNAFYVFFAAVYGAPILLLTGDLGWGLTLCGLSIVRWAASLHFVREP